MRRRRCKWFVVLVIWVPLLMESQGGVANAITQTPSRHSIEQNIREGFAANTGFELVTFESVPGKHGGRVLQESGSEYGRSIRYPLHLHPHTERYRISGDQLKHIHWVTLAWREGHGNYPFVFDLYLHGDSDSENQLAFRVANLDIRKFLHQSIAHVSADQDLARLQAYFAEFSRKAKILSPLPLSSREGAAKSVSYNERMLSEIHQGLVQAIARLRGIDEAEIQPLNRALQQFQRKEPLNLDVVYRNLQVAIASSKKNKDSIEDDANNGAVLERLNERVTYLTTARRISSLKITNNCREPGNYEIEIRDGLSRPLLRATFNFHTQLYNRILSGYHGMGIREQGTGIRVSREIRKLDWIRYWDSLLPWKWLKSFPKVKVDALSVTHPQGDTALSDITPISGEIEVIKGRIPFEDYEEEVRRKSEYHFQGPEPLSYVRVDPGLPVPIGLESPNGVTALTYWTSKENASKVVPHHFRNFEDVQRYDVYFSEFDLNGVYIGQSELREYDKEAQEGRWQFNFQYLQDLAHFEIRTLGEGNTEIRLKSRSTDKEAVNFIFGNFSIEIGESVEFLFGMGTQPLITSYNTNVYQDPLLYGFAYGPDGTILDHHDPRIGVEQVYIERLDAQSYKVRLISYERILPLWEGIIRIANPA